MDPISDLQRDGLRVYRNAALKATAQKVAGDTLRVNVYGWVIQNLDAAIAYIHLYDKASPTVGTDVPKVTIPLAASGVYTFSTDDPIQFSTALYVAATTTIGGSVAPTNGELVNILYYAPNGN